MTKKENAALIDWLEAGDVLILQDDGRVCEAGFIVNFPSSNVWAGRMLDKLQRKYSFEMQISPAGVNVSWPEELQQQTFATWRLAVISVALWVIRNGK